MGLSILISAVAVIGLIAVLMAVTGGKRKTNGKKSGKNTKEARQKGRAAIIRDATKRLSHDPRDPQGLIPLADLYFSEHLWEKAYPLYETMSNIAPAHKEIDPYTAAARLGICALNLNKFEEAVNSMTLAQTMRPSNFEANYYYGMALFRTNAYEKAIPCFKKALIINHEASEVFAPLGISLYKFKRYKDALPYLKHALDAAPEDKELLFAMAYSMQETGHADKALKIFTHLRADAEFGAQSALAAGMLHMRGNAQEKAILDFELGLKHQNVPVDTLLELKYRLATCYFALNQFGKGLPLLKDIMAVNPRYKDVPALLARNQELNQNSNLQIYLVSAMNDFVTLCRKITTNYFPQAHTKIAEVSPQSAFTEITTEIDTPKWSDVIIFRFYRTTGSTGELYVRDFYGKVQDSKAGRGVCVTAGTFSDEAKKFVDGRSIDLVEKPELIQLLKKVDMAH